MANAPTAQLADTKTTDELPPAPRISILLTLVEGADLDAALAIVRRQAYEPAPDIVIVGEVDEAPEDVAVMSTLEEAIGDASSDTDYLWLLHSDARPRPDALSKLVSEIERNDASLAGSKLLIAGTRDILESVGSATDVFGEPYSGLEEGEVDLQQYDVVREVAFVRSASMLVRRDLAQGLKGLDVLLPPVAAGLDFSQRARLAGGRVISVPSSEVYHQGRCNEGGTGWREQAGRLRAMLTAYSPLTLLWVIPYDFGVSILDSLGSLLLLRWRPAARHLRSWLWNLYHLPSTIGLRRRFRPVRSAGDEELFRFQARGSVRLREVGSELSGRVLSVFDEDQALARGSRRVGASPGIWGAVIAAFIILVGVRGFLFSGIPDAGFSFPFESPLVALDRWMGGWNETGMGSPDAVHPGVGLAGLASLLFFGAEGAARTILTVAFGFVAVLGMGRLSGRLSVRGPGRYLSGIVLVAGPGTALLTGAGSWLALGAAAALPWAVRAATAHASEGMHWLSRYGWALLLGLILGALSPILAPIPLLAALLWGIWGGSESRVLQGAVIFLAGTGVALAFLIGDPGWLLDADRRLGLVVQASWPILIAIAALPLVLAEPKIRRLGILGGLLSLAGLLVARVPYGGPGVEEAGLVVASFGAALIVAAGLDSFSTRLSKLMAVVPALVLLFFSFGSVLNGRLGLSDGDINERFGFASTLAGEEGPGRILVASTVREDIPGESRPGPGFWYRVVDGEEMTLDEVWLAEALAGDEELRDALTAISTGSELRPGELLAPFAIDWLVLSGPQFRLDEVLVAQLDLVPTPLDPESRVYENPGSLPIAATGSGSVWMRSGTGFSGDAGPGRVDLSVNFDQSWVPESEPSAWSTTVSASEGEADYQGSGFDWALAIVVGILFLGSVCMVIVGGARR